MPNQTPAERLREMRAVVPSSSSAATTDEQSASRVLSRAQNTVDRSALLLVCGERLAMLGQVSAAMHTIVAAEAKERRELMAYWDYSIWMGEVMEGEGRVVAEAIITSRPATGAEKRPIKGRVGSASGRAATPNASADPDIEASGGRQAKDSEGIGRSDSPKRTASASSSCPSRKETRSSPSKAPTSASASRPPPPRASSPPQQQKDGEKSEGSPSRGRFKLSSAAMGILRDPLASEKVMRAQQERRLERLLAVTRPASDAVPRLHFVPPARLSINTLDKAYTAPILSALFGPTSASDALIEGRPLKATRKTPNQTPSSVEVKRSPVKMTVITTPTNTTTHATVGGATLNSTDGSSANSENTTKNNTPPPKRQQSQSVGGLAAYYNRVPNSTSSGGLSAAMAKSFTPLPQNRKGVWPKEGQEQPSTNLGIPVGLLLATDSNRMSGDSAANSDAAHRSKASLRPHSPASSPLLQRRVASPATGASVAPGSGENRGRVGEGDPPPSAFTRSQSTVTTTAADETRPTSNANLEEEDRSDPSAGPATGAAWQWAEIDSARAVAVMACLVADGLDEVAVREGFSWDVTTEEDAEEGDDADKEAANQKQEEEEGALVITEQSEEDAVPKEDDTTEDAEIEAFLKARGKLSQGPPSITSTSYAHTMATLRNPTRTLSVEDAEAIEAAVQAAKTYRGGAVGEDGLVDDSSSSPPPPAPTLIRAEWLRKAARAFRAATNKITVEEHEDRYEIVHAEISAYRAIMSQHTSSLAVVRKATLTGQQHARMVLERRCTLDLLKIVLLWQHQHEAIMEVYWARRAVLQRVSSGRRALEKSETVGRSTIVDYALVLSKRLLREECVAREQLAPNQAAYALYLKEEAKKAMAARQLEISRLERERLIREHQEVERLMKQKEALRLRREEQWKFVDAVE